MTPAANDSSTNEHGQDETAPRADTAGLAAVFAAMAADGSDERRYHLFAATFDEADDAVIEAESVSPTLRRDQPAPRRLEPE